MVNFKVTQFNINEYDQIIKHFNLTYQDISQYKIFSSLNCPINFLNIKTNCEGVSKENKVFSYFTSDNKYILKTIEKPELNVIIMMAKEYAKRVTSSNSYLFKIFGALKLKCSRDFKFYVILIENFDDRLKNSLIFQLNGSRLENKPVNNKKLLLGPLFQKNHCSDYNFFRDIDKLNIKRAEMDNIVNTLKENIKSLKSTKKVDYKLRVLLQALPLDHENIIIEESGLFKSDKYLVCIGIDFINKKTSKTNVSPSEMSPAAYKIRIFNLIDRMFKANN